MESFWLEVEVKMIFDLRSDLTLVIAITSGHARFQLITSHRLFFLNIRVLVNGDSRTIVDNLVYIAIETEDHVQMEYVHV